MVVLGITTIISYGTTQYLFGVLVVPLDATFHWGRASISAYGAFSPLRASVMADHFGRRAYGSITAVQGIPVAVCAGLGPLAAGWLYDGLHHYEMAFWLCAGAFLLAAISIAITSQPRHAYSLSLMGWSG